MALRTSDGVELRAEVPRAAAQAVTREALQFVARLHRRFNPAREELLSRRAERQAALNAGEVPGFLPETAGVRAGTWSVVAAPPALRDRRVEITGPVDRKMMINALNSGASVFMADFEDSLSPTWTNVAVGQANLMEAVRGTLSYESGDGRSYRLNDRTATLLVRPRGWHLVESHVLLDGTPLSASLFDFGVFFFQNAQALLDRGAGPYFYLPKLEGHREARLWNEVFVAAQEMVGLPRGTIRATVLIETILAAFEMDEILYELRDHVAGLNAGRWDYIFSVIKKFRDRRDMVLPDRAQVTMAVPFMRAYTESLVETCHRRGAYAIGGMSAFIPSRRDPAVNERALAKVREDKQREAGLGFDGSWVAHPDLVPVVRDVFDEALSDAPNQLERRGRGEGGPVTPQQLLDVSVPGGQVTREGVRMNVSVALQYLESWLRGSGAVAINDLMEDTATAEISRAQLWQWIRHAVPLDGTGVMSADLYRDVRDEQLDALKRQRRGATRLDDAAALLDDLVLGDTFTEFLTLPAARLLGNDGDDPPSGAFG